MVKGGTRYGAGPRDPPSGRGVSNSKVLVWKRSVGLRPQDEVLGQGVDLSIVEHPEQGESHEDAKSRRAALRQTLFGDLRFGDEADQTATFLERRPIKGATRTRYSKVWGNFLKWAKSRGFIVRQEELDNLLVEYLDHLFFAGSGRGGAQFLLAAAL